MTPARVCVALILAAGLGSWFLDPWNYLRYLVLAVQALLTLVALILALSRYPIDKFALKAIGALLFIALGAPVFSALLEGTGWRGRDFLPYDTRAVWGQSMRATAWLWGSTAASLVLGYAWHSRHGAVGSRRALGWLLLISGLPTSLLLPTTLFEFLADSTQVAVAFCFPWFLVTLSAEGLAFTASKHGLTRPVLVRTAAFALAMALSTLALLVTIWTELPDPVALTQPTSAWRLLRWQQLGPHFTVLAAIWLLLGLWLGREAWFTARTRTATVRGSRAPR